MNQKTREELKGEIKNITTSYLIGMSYTIPPFNGKHSQEYFDQLLTLFTEQLEKEREEITKKLEYEWKRMLKYIWNNRTADDGENIYVKFKIKDSPYFSEIKDEEVQQLPKDVAESEDNATSDDGREREKDKCECRCHLEDSNQCLGCRMGDCNNGYLESEEQ